MSKEPKFRTKRGKLTMYSFLCGYIETREIDSDNRATLELDGIFHVKGFYKGDHFWHMFERNELAKARKCFNNVLKGAKP